MDGDVGIGLLGLVAGAAMTAFLMGLHYEGKISEHRERAIEHGCASYDSRTGEWGWVEKRGQSQ